MRSHLNSSQRKCTYSHNLVADSSTFYNRAAHRERGINEYTLASSVVDSQDGRYNVQVGVYYYRRCLNRENFCGSTTTYTSSSSTPFRAPTSAASLSEPTYKLFFQPFTDAICHGCCSLKLR